MVEHGNTPSAELERRRLARMRPLEAEANRAGLHALGALVEAVSYWDDNPKLYIKVLDENLAKGTRELRDFLQELPARYGYESATEYVLGYKPAGTVFDKEDEEALKSYNRFMGQSLNTSLLSHLGAESLRWGLDKLLQQVADFTARRHQIALLTRESRLRQAPTWARMPFSEEGPGEPGSITERLVGQEMSEPEV